MIEETQVQCPYCGERIGLELDLSEGDSTYVQDCTVCCQPILVTVRLDHAGGHTVEVRQENG